MRRHFAPVTDSESETEYSESDLSMLEFPRRSRRHSVHRRSISRHRHGAPEHNSTTLLTPIMQDVHLHRSASTGGRRRRERERVPAQPPAVIVDIKNESRNKSSNRARRQHQEFIDIESEDDTLLRTHHRPRARTTSISREASPRAVPVAAVPPPPPQAAPANARDFDLVIDQRLLEKSDARQDLELLRHQAEIDRLERELARHREQHLHQQQQVAAPAHRDHSQTRPVMFEDDWYEDELSEKLRRLERMERKQREQEEQRKAEQRHKLRQWEDEQRRQQEEREVKEKLRAEKLRELQQKIEEEEERERLKKEIRDEEARLAFEQAEKAKKEMLQKQAAIDEYKLMEEKRKIAEKEMKKRADEEFRKRLREEFGHTEEEIDKIINKRKEKEEKGKEKEKDKKDKDDKDDKEDDEDNRRTWIKVHRKYLLPDTLMAYRLPWDWDERDRNYIIIKQWITEDLQEELFSHTRRIREGKLVTQTSSTQTELRVRDGKKDKLYLVRKKSPNRRAFLFT